ASISLLCCLSPTVSLAQANGTSVDEIIVTAQKREQTLQEVPLAVSVLSADALDDAFITDLEDLAELVPSLTVTQGNSDRNSALRIRGIGTQVFSVSVEPSVSTVIDGVVLTRPGSAFTDLVDIERVEVLRGPQGTLFGKNASAGVLNVVTKDPSSVFEGFAEVQVAEDNEYLARGSLSGPIASNLAYRASAFIKGRDGYIENIAGDDVNGSDSFGGRAKVLWEPSDVFSLQLIGDYTESDANCCQWQIRSTNNAGFRSELAPIVPGPENDQVDVNAPLFNDSEHWGVSAEMNWDLGKATLTSISAFRDWSNRGNQDIDSVSETDPLPGRIRFNVNDGVSATETITQELRLASNGENTLNYVVGLFYYDTDITRRLDRELDICLAPGTGGAGCGFVFTQSGFFTTSVDNTNYAAFGQLDWNLTDKLGLIFGARYLKDELGFTLQRFGNVSGGPVGPFSDDTSDTDFSIKVGATYDLSENWSSYATYQQGYKGRGYDTGIDSNPSDLAALPIEAETSDAYEIGLKGSLADRRIILNMAAFHTKFDNFQGQAFNPASARFLLANVGEVETTGFEIDGVARLNENFTLSGGLAVVDAVIKTFPGASCYNGQSVQQGCVNNTQNLAGAPLPNAPSIKFNIGAEYRRDIALSGWEGFLGWNYTWQDDVQFGLNQNPATIQDDYGIANFRIGAVSPDDKYELNLFVQNAFDQSYAASIFQTPLDGGGISHILPRNYSRYFGASLRASF
ncbi:MAG: TonB-dependent receptor, partial [Pricia sp.]